MARQPFMALYVAAISPVARMKPFDLSAATDDEIVAEAEARWREREGTPRVAPGTIARQVTIEIPFAVLVSDNDHLVPRVIKKMGRAVPLLCLDPRYKKARGVIKLLVAKQLGPGWVPFGGPCEMSAEVYEPNRSRGRDVANFAKGVQDALNKLVYADDALLDRVTWTRREIDPDNPRCVITVTGLDK